MTVTETTDLLRANLTQHDRDAHPEGKVAKTIENETAKVPSDWWLWAAVASMSLSLVLKLSNRKSDSQFLGQWAAPLLLMGVYNKIVKVAGSDSRTGPR